MLDYDERNMLRLLSRSLYVLALQRVAIAAPRRLKVATDLMLQAADRCDADDIRLERSERCRDDAHEATGADGLVKCPSCGELVGDGE